MKFGKNLSKNLKIIRGTRSQAEFAQEIGISKSVVQAIEHETSGTRLDTLEQICSTLGVPVGAILSEDLQDTEADLLWSIFQGVQRFSALSEQAQGDAVKILGQILDLYMKLAELLKEDGHES